MNEDKVNVLNFKHEMSDSDDDGKDMGFGQKVEQVDQLMNDDELYDYCPEYFS